MTVKTKKTIAIIALLVIALVGGIGVLIVSQRISSQRSVSPAAPDSRPRAAEWTGAEACNAVFTIGEEICAPTREGTASATFASGTILCPGSKVVEAVGGARYSYTYRCSDMRVDGVLATRNNDCVDVAYSQNVKAICPANKFLVGVKTGTNGAIPTAVTCCGYTAGSQSVNHNGGEQYKVFQNNVVVPFPAQTVAIGLGDTLAPDYDIDQLFHSTLVCAPKPKICNESCSADSECGGGMTCSGGVCRNPSCTGESSCSCPAATLTPASCGGTCSGDTDCSGGMTCNSGICRNPACSSEPSCVCPTPTPAACNGACGNGITCGTGMICSSGVCRNPSCTGESSCTCPTATPTTTVTTTATPTSTTTTKAICSQSCNVNADCMDGLFCSNGYCRNAECAADTDCLCNATPTPTPTTTISQLPEAGIGLPTMAAVGGGILMILLGILFAL